MPAGWCWRANKVTLSHLHPIIRDCFVFAFQQHSFDCVVHNCAKWNNKNPHYLDLMTQLKIMVVICCFSAVTIFIFFSRIQFLIFHSGVWRVQTGSVALLFSLSTYAALETVRCQTQPIHTCSFFKSQNQSREKQSAAAGISLWSFHLYKH